MKFWAAGTLALTVAVAGCAREQQDPVEMQSGTSDLVAKSGVLMVDIGETCSFDQYTIAVMDMLEFVPANTPNRMESTQWIAYHEGAERAARLIRGDRYMPDAERCATIMLEHADIRGKLRTQLYEHYQPFGE